ncbi:MAG: TonB-dependent receptor [Bacteroidia bacterium]
MKKTFLLFALTLCFSIIFAQSKHTISGYVKDAKTGESLSGATILLENTEFGTYSNEYGFYSLTIAEGNYTLRTDYIGYKPIITKLELKADQSINLKLEEEDVKGDEVLITSERGEANVKSTEMGTVELKIDDIKKLPVLLGEVDIMKTIQLLPGVQAAEGTSGLYIRGGGPDQNLILLDEAPVYNPGHLFGFFSVFNGDAVRDFKLHKGNMPAQYGGRLSSVVDVSMKEGNNQTYHGKGGIGLISSRLTLEGPIVKDKASFMVAARRTYAGELAQPFISDSSNFKGSNYYFYDANLKVNYSISDKDRIYLSGYFGRDVFNFKSKFSDFTFNIPWGNATATARWNHLFTNKLFMNATVVFNDYNFSFGSKFNVFEFGLSSRVKDWNAKVDFDYYPNPKHKIKFGANYIYHTFDPNGLYAKIDTFEINAKERFKKKANEVAAYIQDEWNITDKFQVNAGLRFSGFQHLGPYTYNKYNVEKDIVDSVVYNKGDIAKTYGGIEPRIAARYSLTRSSSLKASFNINTQYIHLVSISGSFPSDIWVPSTERVKPQRGQQYSFGYFQNFKENMFEVSGEIFYRRMRNQVEYSKYYSFDVRNDYELQYVFGNGTAYGLELFFQKTKGALTGWVGYTLSRSTRLFNGSLPLKDSDIPAEDLALNDGQSFPFTYDRRHNISVVVSYEIRRQNNKRPINLSGVFVYGTGNAITPILRRYVVDNQIVNLYGPRNSFRMLDYHRVDVSATFPLAFRKQAKYKFQSDLIVSVYNSYNRWNPFFVYFETKGDPLSASLQTQAYQITVFPIIPSITWDFQF